jgi:hypothetical protein
MKHFSPQSIEKIMLLRNQTLRRISLRKMNEQHITGYATYEIKLGDFKPEHKGQMELYLRWLNKHERREGEEPPMGLILCAGKKQERIELLELSDSGIHVAEYLTALPPKAILREKLYRAIVHARQRLEDKSEKTKLPYE